MQQLSEFLGVSLSETDNAAIHSLQEILQGSEWLHDIQCNPFSKELYVIVDLSKIQGSAEECMWQLPSELIQGDTTYKICGRGCGKYKKGGRKGR